MHSINSFQLEKKRKKSTKFGNSTYLSLFSFLLSFSKKFIFGQFLVGSPHGHIGSPSKLSIKNPFILNMKSLIMHWIILKILDYEIICIIGKWSSKNGWLSVYVRIENKSTAKKICLHKLKLDRLMFRVWALNILSRFSLLCLRITKYKAIILVMNRPKGKMMR